MKGFVAIAGLLGFGRVLSSALPGLDHRSAYWHRRDDYGSDGTYYPPDAQNPFGSWPRNTSVHQVPQQNCPWKDRNTTNANPYKQMPNTGATRKYDFTITRGILNPDGYPRPGLLINSQFPGPLIEANWGDTIQVTVHNAITGPGEGTAMHWHGLLQTESQWDDGVPGTSECPIPPGMSHTYTFIATLYGTTWYHSHQSAQYADGLIGPLIVHGPTKAHYDVDVGPVILQDYYHRTYNSIVADVMGTDLSKVRPHAVNNLINGKMSFNCSTLDPEAAKNSTGVCSSNAPLSQFKFTSGKSHRLRLINAGAASIQKFSVDAHTMTVIAYDFTPIKPYNTSVVTLAVGQRADVIILANGQADQAYWMRATSSAGQCTEPSDQPNGLAVVRYERSNGAQVPSSRAWTDTTDPCRNDPLSSTVPLYAMNPGIPTRTMNIVVDFTVNATGHLVWLMNGQSFRTNWNKPILLLSKGGNNSYPYDQQWNAIELNGDNQTSVRLVVTNKTPTSHPMHLHGHNFFVLNEGTGTWDGSIINPDNPIRRDVHIMPAGGFMVAQFNLDNPGTWPFHCHIAWHVSAGLQVTFVERPNDILKIPVPQSSYDMCTAWNSYTDDIIVDQLDSGQ